MALFDKAVQKADVWVNEMAKELGLAPEERELAWLAMRAGLHALRDRLAPQEAVDLAAQLPALVRAAYIEGWRIAGKPMKVRHVDDLVALVRRELAGDTRVDPGRVMVALFKVLDHHLSPGETDAVRHVLPRPLAELFPHHPQA